MANQSTANRKSSKARRQVEVALVARPVKANNRVIREITIPIGHMNYRLQLYAGTLRLGSEPCHGISNFNLRLIQIADTLPVDQRVETFWHELGHVAQDAYAKHYKTMEDEPFADAVQFACARIDSKTLARIEACLCAPHDGEFEGGAK